MKKTSKVLIAGFCSALISFMAFSGCSNDTEDSGDPPTIDDRHANITFRVPGEGDVVFGHQTHADYYDNTCLICHMHTDVRDDTIWSCSQCHDNQDSDGLCADDNWDHDCMYVQCQDCHSQQSTDPTPDCADCHGSPPVTNSPPVASSVGMIGTLAVNQTVTGTYTYSDPEGNLEGASTYQWFLADDAMGTNTTAITGATNITYQPVNADIGKFLIFEVTPVAQTGTSPGSSAQSAASGPITFDPANTAPTASNTVISGVPNTHFVLNASYDYNDVDGDPEGSSIYQWYVADDAIGTNAAAIVGATSLSYTPLAGDVTRYIFFEVTPVAQTGNPQGAPSTSSAVGPVTDTTATVFSSIDQASEVDSYEFSLNQSTNVTIDVQSVESDWAWFGYTHHLWNTNADGTCTGCHDEGGPADLGLSGGSSDDKLYTNIHLFNASGPPAIESRLCSNPACGLLTAGCFPGCDHPDAGGARSERNPYLS
ncbi:MAG: hypothetical protein PVI06_15980, partial [Desulfobacterales bacterium]